MTQPSDPDTRYYERLLIDRVPSMLAYWDSNLLCRFANKAYERWFGVDPERLLGTSIRDLLGPELFAKNEPHIRAALAGERQVFERIVPGPGGAQRNSLAEYMPHVVDGTVRGFLVQVTELTELRQTQEALRREQQYRTELEAQSTEVSALLRERTEMLHVLAHEVRQPLNNASAALQSAHGALQEAANTLVSEEVLRAQSVLGEVLSNIDNTIAVASLLARPNPIQVDDTDIDTWVRIAIADMPECQQVRIQVLRETSTRTALMDMSLMRLALRNLLSNALRFSPAECPVVLRITDSDDPPALLIDVTDKGPGIPADLLPQLFTRGTRGVGKNAGHGVGLYIVRQVMQMHGGAVDVVRNAPGGVTMRITLHQTDRGS